MIAALEMQGIGVMCWHPESGWGQFEVVLEWAEVEEVVERVIFARTVSEILSSERSVGLNWLIELDHWGDCGTTWIKSDVCAKSVS